MRVQKTRRYLSESNKPFMIFQMVILFFCGLSPSIHGISPLFGIIVWLFQLTNICGLGLTVNHIMKIREENNLTTIAYAYGTGCVSLLLEYMLLVSLKLQPTLPIIAVVQGGGISVYYYKYIKLKPVREERWDWSIGILATVILLSVAIVAVSMDNSLPNEVGGNGYAVDWPFWVGNNISFTKGFPAQNFRLVGRVFRYHYFSSIIIAMSSLMTKIDPVIMSFYFSFILSVPLLVLSGLALAKAVTSDLVLQTLALVALIFTDGSTTTSAWHELICPFGFDYGYIYGMFGLAVLLKLFSGETHIRYQFLSLIYLFMATGSKGPVGIVVLAGYGIYAIKNLCERKFKIGFLYGMTALAVFVSTYFLFIHDSWILHASNGLKYLGIRGAFAQNDYIQGILGEVSRNLRVSPDHRIFKMYSLWLYIYRMNNGAIALTILAAACGIVAIIWKKKLDWVLLSLLAVAFVGVYLMSSTIQDGGSWMYFGMACIPGCVAAGFYALKYFESRLQTKLLMTAMMCIFIGFSVERYASSVLPKIYEGLCVFRGGGMTKSDFREGLYVDADDYALSSWLKENTGNNAVVAVDSLSGISESEHGLDMLYGVFSERYIYNETKYSFDADESARRNRVVSQIYHDTPRTIKELDKEGVDYLVQTRSIHSTPIQDNRLEMKYQNGKYYLYKINM